MKKIVLASVALVCSFSTQAQNTIESFESFTLAPNSFYKDTNDTPFQTATAIFEHSWETGSFPYWSSGFSYTNKYDSTTAGYTNLYGAIPYKGYNNSNVYVVAQDGGIIRLKNNATVVNGFYYTNTTYAYKSMKLGDMFARKFGDTTGTGSGTTIAQGAYPDYFKLVVRGYKNGTLKADSIEIYLADYRSSNSAQDYIVNDWQFASTAALGAVDSISFKMRSSVYNNFGMLTPGFFAIDNFETSPFNPVGISTLAVNKTVQVFPVPMEQTLSIIVNGNFEYRLYDALGNTQMQGRANALTQLNVESLAAGSYFLEVISEEGVQTKKLIK